MKRKEIKRQNKSKKMFNKLHKYYFQHYGKNKNRTSNHNSFLMLFKNHKVHFSQIIIDMLLYLNIQHKISLFLY